MQRYCQVIELPAEHRVRYLALHADVWPEVERTLREANIANYSIFERDGLLVGYFEYHGTDFAKDSARIAADAATQRWWALTDPCQRRLAGTPEGQQWATMTPVWHLADAPQDVP